MGQEAAEIYNGLSQGDRVDIEYFHTLSEIQLSFLNEAKDILSIIH